MELTRAGLLLIAALAAGCSTATKSPIVSAVLARTIGRDAAPQDAGQPLPPASALREPISAQGVAAIRIESPATGVADVMIAIALEGDRVTYLGRNNRTVLVRGGLLYATHGFGYDLSPTQSDGDDPVAVPRPLDSWPTGVRRIYRTPGLGPEGDVTAVECRYALGETESIGYFDPPVTVREVSESCSGDGVSFVNSYQVEPGTGRVWTSEQWTGPRQGMARLDILEPFDP